MPQSLPLKSHYRCKNKKGEEEEDEEKGGGEERGGGGGKEREEEDGNEGEEERVEEGEENDRKKNGRRAGETLIPTSLSGRPYGKTMNCTYSSKSTPSFPLNIHSISTTTSLRND